MKQRTGTLYIAEASRSLERLCCHFQRKITVLYDAHHGEAEFPWSRCVLRADGELLSFECTAADQEGLSRVQSCD
jgi:hypothetical protein